LVHNSVGGSPPLPALHSSLFLGSVPQPLVSAITVLNPGVSAVPSMITSIVVASPSDGLGLLAGVCAGVIVPGVRNVHHPQGPTVSGISKVVQKSVGRSVHKKAATAYSNGAGVRFRDFLLTKNKGLLNAGMDGAKVDYESLASLAEADLAALLIEYGAKVNETRKVGSDFTSLRFLFNVHALVVPAALRTSGKGGTRTAVELALVGWRKQTTQREVSLNKEKRHKSEIPNNVMERQISIHRRGVPFKLVGTQEKLTSCCLIMGYSRGKRACTLVHTTPVERAADKDIDSEEDDDLGRPDEYHVIQAGDLTLMDSNFNRYNPISYREAFWLMEKL
jgi:hypothetical protein